MAIPQSQPKLAATPIAKHAALDADITAIVNGANATLAALAQVWPDAGPEEVLMRLSQLAESAIAQELLGMVLEQKGIQLG
jgi:hypothetical protein